MLVVCSMCALVAGTGHKSSKAKQAWQPANRLLEALHCQVSQGPHLNGAGEVLVVLVLLIADCDVQVGQLRDLLGRGMAMKPKFFGQSNQSHKAVRLKSCRHLQNLCWATAPKVKDGQTKSPVKPTGHITPAQTKWRQSPVKK